MKVARRSVASRTDESAELKRQLDVADADIALVNKRLDEAQGMLHRYLIRGVRCSFLTIYICLLQIVLLPWRTFRRNLPEPRSKQEKVMLLPLRRLKS